MSGLLGSGSSPFLGLLNNYDPIQGALPASPTPPQPTPRQNALQNALLDYRTSVAEQNDPMPFGSLYSATGIPAWDSTQDLRPLNYRRLAELGAWRVTMPGNTSSRFSQTDNPWHFSMVSRINDQVPTQNGAGAALWPNHPNPQALENALTALANYPPHRGKYNQILDSARALGIREEDIFMPGNGR